MLLMATLVSVATAVFSMVPIESPVLSGNPTGIAPLYFGPNALPVPDMLDGRTRSQLRLELAGDGYWGTYGDQTADVFARIYVPLFTPRVNLTLWMPIMEWYSLSNERRSMCRIPDTTLTHGREAGDVYVSTDIHVLKQKRFCPDIAIRAAIKSASGGGFAKARYYDNPGYFFDVSVGKSIYIGKGKASGLSDKSLPFELRLSGSAGFLCWQTDNGRQNDAVMYGLQLLLQRPYLSLRTSWEGYVGWEDYGDHPMVIKTQLCGHIRSFEPYLQYQYGIHDYPFHQLRIGLAYHFNILKR